ncbi:MAG: hypothetical protein JNL70_16175 [Saprospiraceae bacterium]|nr:hypothetical protein [Saprospiraceae bacterium]
MFKYLLRTQEGRDLMAGVPLVLFLLVFIGTLAYLFLMNKKQVSKMSSLPLEDGTKQD